MSFLELSNFVESNAGSASGKESDQSGRARGEKWRTARSDSDRNTWRRQGGGDQVEAERPMHS